MRVVILGAGNVGALVAHDLSKDFEVWVADKDHARLSRVSRVAQVVTLDASKPESVSELVRGFDLVVNALPGFLGFRALKASLQAKRDTVDVSFMPEDPLHLNAEVSRLGIKVVVDAGFAPGLSNILVGHIYNKLGPMDEGVINVGGLPKEPRPPLYHQVLFSPYDLIDEYLRPARCVVEGRVVDVDPLQRIESVRVGNFIFERFISDGLRTLLTTVKARNMAEYTLRWPRHLERMKTLKELGFFRKEFLEHTIKVILPAMQYDSPDFSIMEVYGRKDDVTLGYYMYDEASSGFTSMSRVTGFMTAIITRLVARGNIAPGVIPPEYLGMDDRNLEYVLSELRKRGVTIESTSLRNT
ncbi:MAG: saccharopine dehydrogenase C-terminal domain-containing protein [Zestosphaera sp.]